LDKPKDEMVLIKPAVDGTMAAMRACHKHKVKRIVITSSIAAIYKCKDKTKVDFSNEDWTDCEIAEPYEKSKTMAEKAAWDFLESLPENERFECATINPGFVIGPNLNTAFFTSGDVISKILTGEFPGFPDIRFPTVDVRDVAQAHLEAILRPEAAGKRFILCAEAIPFI